MRFSLLSSLLVSSVVCVLGDPVITSFPDSLALDASFDPIKEAYWTGLPHHRRTPFSVRQRQSRQACKVLTISRSLQMANPPI
jgi:hypothetical protein